MTLPKLIRKTLKAPLLLALRCGFIRRRIAFELKHRWFSDLQLSIPLTHNFSCPIPELDSFYSFSEIFAAEEYGSFLEDIPLPRRWIDLGCHMGYFTLYLAWKNAMAGQTDWQALLIDADPRVERPVREMLEGNGIAAQCRFLGGGVGAPGAGHFALRPGMGSSTRVDVAGIQGTVPISRIEPARIMAELAPPYDLLKIDIEGAEYEFLEHYAPVIAQARAVLLEWHEFGTAEVGRRSAEAILAAEGFGQPKTLRPERVLDVEGLRIASGVQLYRRAA